MKKMKLIVIAILALLAAVIILQNVETVDTKILFITISMPRAILLAVTWAIGLACGLLIQLKAKKKAK